MLAVKFGTWGAGRLVIPDLTGRKLSPELAGRKTATHMAEPPGGSGISGTPYLCKWHEGEVKNRSIVSWPF